MPVEPTTEKLSRQRVRYQPSSSCGFFTTDGDGFDPDEGPETDPEFAQKGAKETKRLKFASSFVPFVTFCRMDRGSISVSGSNR
jgi:hypothetical protein